MIDYGFYGQLATVTIVCICIAHIIVKRAREYGRPIITVEREQEEVREVQATLGQHHPTIGSLDHYRDPMWQVVNLLGETNRALM